MKLPQPFIESRFFMFSELEEVIHAIGNIVSQAEILEMRRLTDLELPPITSRESVGVMLGINPGLVWSFENRTSRHYNRFRIPKGNRQFRDIVAPRVALKILQKWISFHLQRRTIVADHVYGFVPGRSHIQAAQVHAGASWIYSIDIRNFFPSTPYRSVVQGFRDYGYNEISSLMIASFCCYQGFLAQGAPTSPVLSNQVFFAVDRALSDLSIRLGVSVSRYADDIVFSGTGEKPDSLEQEVANMFAETPWQLAADKEQLTYLPKRLKVHGLLVHGDAIRLTKGYRNKIRAYRHLLSNNLAREEDRPKFAGHLEYFNQVQRYLDQRG